MPFDLTVNKQGKGHNGDPGPMSSNNYIMVGGGEHGTYFVRGGQVFDSTGVLVEGEMPESVYNALKQMTNEGRAAVGFDTIPGQVDRPVGAVGVDFTTGPGATPMQLNAPKPGLPDTGKAEPVPQGDVQTDLPVRGQRNFVDPVNTAARQQSAQAQEEARLQALRDAEHAPVNEAHKAKIDAARRAGSKIDPSLLTKK